jgi:CDP-diacylglycerol---glycerol-3-phosphate 3-phosphatidyltransferase
MPLLSSTRGRYPPLLPFAVAAPLCGGAAALILFDHPVWAGLSALVAAALYLSASEPPGDPRTTFAGRMLDRAFEACTLAPLAWVARQASPRVAVLALVGLGASYLASYERARGESLGYREGEGGMFRTARAALLVVALLTGWIESLLWAFAVLTGSASAVRAVNVAHQERRTRLTAAGGG